MVRQAVTEENKKYQIKISCLKWIKVIFILSILSIKNTFFITYTIYTSSAGTVLQLAYLYSDSYVLATSAYNTQYLNKFYHYYLFIPFIFNVAIYNFQFKNLYFIFVVFVQYKNLYFFVVVPLADVSEILICLYISFFLCWCTSFMFP